MTNHQENRPENAQSREDIERICQRMREEPEPLPEAAKQAITQYEEIKKALIGPKPDDPKKNDITWVLPNPDPKTNFSTP